MEGSAAEMCEGSPLTDVDGGVWQCGQQPITYGTMCELDCTDPYSIPEGDYLVTCTPEGWLPDPAQVSQIIKHEGSYNLIATFIWSEYY